MSAFIVLEGGEGVGKSTAAAAIKKMLGDRCVLTREPGGTALGEKLRKIILHEPDNLTVREETLLIAASRLNHISAVIMPELIKNKVVVCDRYLGSTIAYQSAGKGLPKDSPELQIACHHNILQPDITIYLDCPVSVGFSRKENDILDNIERNDPAFFHRVRDSFLEQASNPTWKVVDSNREKSEVHNDIINIVRNLLI